MTTLFRLRNLVIFGVLLGLMAVSVPAQAATIMPGDLIKTATSSTVYYYGYDGKRHAFPTEKTYFSWYASFSNIKTVTGGELAAIPLGHSIVVRPGTYLIKVTTDPKVYAVEPQGRLRHIVDVSQAQLLYGVGWQSLVVDIPDSLMADYTVGDALPLNRHPTGTVFRYENESSYYLLTNGYSRKFLSLVGWEQYHWNPLFLRELPFQYFKYSNGESLDQFRVALSDTAQTLIESEVDDLVNYRQYDQALPQGSGLKGEYYKGANFDSYQFSRVDSTINFDWAGGSPGSGLESDYYSIRWNGNVVVDKGGTITFWVQSDDGMRLYIDGRLVIDAWNDHKARWDSAAVTLDRGQHSLKLEYYEKRGVSLIRLAWNSQSEIIPQTNLVSF